ncbi:ABC transporter ATP-binding protein [Candidatus Fermentibacterales bacterium]|nr:ABC transporter ATP-binding protein [Candidatus Fermentibacterales bacterium]
MMRYLRWIARFWKPHKLHVAALLGLTLISSVVALGFPLVFKFLLDDVEGILGGVEDPSAFNRMLLVLGALALGRFVAGLYPGARAWLNSKIGLGVRDRVFDSLLRKDYRFFNRFKPGDLTTRLTDDIVEYPRIAWFSCSAIFRALESSSRLVFCFAVMLFMSWELTLLAMIPLPIMLLVFYRIEGRLGKAVEENRKATSRTNDLLDSTFAGIAIVKAYRAEKGQAGRLRELLNRRLQIDLDITKLVMIVHSLYNVIGQVGKVVVMFVGGLFVLWGRIGIGEFYAFYVYLDLILAPMMDIPNLFVTARQAFISIDRENEILDFPEPVPQGGSRPVDSVSTIEFDRVGFRFEEGGKGLEDVSFRASAGSIVAVVGEVGSGKSTLLRLLTGELPVQEGCLRVNGHPMHELEMSSYLAQLGYVPQEARLFSDSIEENVILDRAVAPCMVEEVLETVGLGGDELEDGRNTKLGQGGSGISGGQRQRIAIARALAGRPSIVLFDDCTSALDAEHEDLLWRSLRARGMAELVVVVSHRLATIAQSDQVVFLHRGRVEDIGTHAELENRSELYRMVLATEM